MGRMILAPVQKQTGANWSTGAEWTPKRLALQFMLLLGFPPFRGEPNWSTGATGVRVWVWSA